MHFKFRSRPTIFLHDLLMISPAWFGAYWLRFNLHDIPHNYLHYALTHAPFVILVQISQFWCFKLYRGVWRFSSLPDLLRIFKSVLAGVFLIACTLFLYDRLHGLPRSILPLYGMNLLALLCVPRIIYRLWSEHSFLAHTGKRALIIGAGWAGETLVRELQAHRDTGYQPVIFLDDDPNKLNREIRGIRVAGGIEKTPSLINDLNIETIVIAIPSASARQMRRIVEICESTRLPFQTLPSVKELLDGHISKASLRKVSIEDILGREPVRLDWPAIRAHLHNKTILVTGGGGSIGGELCRQLAIIQPKLLIILDQCEYNLYKIDADLTSRHPGSKHLALLGDVADPVCVRHLLHTHQPEIIFHAAAYKHVPLLEHQIRQAAHNNIIGAKILAEAAIAAGVGRFVLISSDKAVNPSNVMGASKRAAEILCQNLEQTGGVTRFVTVRFGNVLDSAGSVVPLFRAQIQAGGPVTVTHPDITRFFMTIPEACQLIMQAETVGRGGEVFVLDMGDPIKISYLAEQMIRLSGLEPNKDIAIEYIGLRPGEKLYEELFHAEEQLQQTPYPKLRKAQARQHDPAAWNSGLAALEQACRDHDDAVVLSLLRQLVPEFAPSPN